MSILFTSESVSEGHPDKICDQISDAILDECLKKDKNSKVACECFITNNQLIIGGEILTKSIINYEKIARNVLKDIGYNDEKIGINWKNCNIKNLIKPQSPDINFGLNINNFGAGDQGIMFGYAINHTKNFMPISINIAHDLMKTASILRKNGKFKYAKPDMKTQVTIDISDIKNIKINTILISIQHDKNYNKFEFFNFIKNNIIMFVINNYNLNKDFKILINTSGRFVIGGPKADTGLTGRKIISDTYGGFSRHGGGSFSGKDCTKLDRSGAYMARYVAKNVVASGLAEICEVQLSYAIGIVKPVSIFIETFNTNIISNKIILKAIKENFDFSPKNIIKNFKLNRPIFKKISNYGHFGRDPDLFYWEKLDKVKNLSKYLY